MLCRHYTAEAQQGLLVAVSATNQHFNVTFAWSQVEKKAERVAKFEKAVQRILQVGGRMRFQGGPVHAVVVRALQLLHTAAIDKNIKGKIALLELLAVSLDEIQVLEF